MRYAPRTAWVIDSAYNPDAATTAPSSVRRECAQQRHHLGGYETVTGINSKLVLEALDMIVDSSVEFLGRLFT